MSATFPTMAGPMRPPRSPAIAKSANIAVPPVGNALEEMLIVLGYMIPTENPHTIHPTSPIIGFSENDAIIPNFLFLPSLIVPAESLIYQKFVLPFLNSSLDYYIFSSSQEWQKEILSEMQKLIQFSKGEINKLQISVQLQKIWALITSNVICYPKTQNVNSSSLARLQMMMQFIHSNYPENISLLDIAQAGEVSNSTALNLVRNVLNTSPVSYLICYRLKKEALLLTNPEKSKCHFNRNRIQ